MNDIAFCDVAYKFHYADYPVLSGATFRLDEAVNTLCADKQSGKSTVCRLLVGDMKAQSGNILLGDLPINSITPVERGILYLSSDYPLFKHKTVADNVEYPLVVRKVARAERGKIIEQALRSVGAAELAKVKVSKLTEEQIRLVVLARGLTVQRKIVLFDDFFAYGKSAQTDFDSYDVQQVLGLFPDATKVVCTSDSRLLVGKTAVLDGGKCVYEGNAEGAQAVVEQLPWLANHKL